MKAAAAAAAALLALALLVQDASPGFLGRLQADMTGPQKAADELRQRVQEAIPVPATGAPAKPKRKKKRKPRGKLKPPPRAGATPVGCRPKRRPPGIPPRYFRLYVKHAGCDWWVIAGVYMVESGHGQSTAPGVKSGRNRHGCCAGPGQFNMGGTAQKYGLDNRTVYIPEYTVPATVRMLRDNGLGSNRVGKCIGTARTYHVPYGTANALWNYNHACWYVAGTLAPGQAYRRQAG